MPENNLIVKVCKTHGELTIENVAPEKSRYSEYYKCRFCKNEKQAKYYAKNKVAVLERARIQNAAPERKAKMKEKRRLAEEKGLIKIKRKEYYDKHREEIREKRRQWHIENYPKIKEEIQAKRRELRQANKEEINRIRREKYKPKLLIPRRKIPLLPKEYQRLYKEKNDARRRKYTADLRDGYVRQLLKLDPSLREGEIPPELIDLKRTLVKIRRILRNENKQH